MQRGILVLGLIISTLIGHAQSVASNNGALKKMKPIHSELSAGFRLNTNGWSLFVDKGYVKSNETKFRDQFHDIRLFQVELSEHKDPKEIKYSNNNQSGQNSRPLIYGKINNFYALKLGYGMRKMIAGKPEPGSVSVHWVYAGGFSLGMEKPYYVDGFVQQDNQGSLVPATFKYSDATKESFLNERYINGGAGFSKGLGEIQYIPGIHAKTAMHFDFAASRKVVMAVETGISAEYYSRAIEIMANQDAKPYLVNLFASFQFGGRK